MEAALAIATLLTVLVLCLGGLAAIVGQVRCVDAAREAARLAARGDQGGATAVVHATAPRGALLRLRVDGAFVVAEVTVEHTSIPGVRLRAEAVSAVESSASR